MYNDSKIFLCCYFGGGGGGDGGEDGEVGEDGEDGEVGEVGDGCCCFTGFLT